MGDLSAEVERTAASTDWGHRKRVDRDAPFSACVARQRRARDPQVRGSPDRPEPHGRHAAPFHVRLDQPHQHEARQAERDAEANGRPQPRVSIEYQAREAEQPLEMSAASAVPQRSSAVPRV